MKAGARLKGQFLHRLKDRFRTSNGTCRSIESSDQAIGGKLHFGSPMTIDLFASPVEELFDPVLPANLILLCVGSRHRENLHVEDGGEHPVGLSSMAGTREEFLYLLDQQVAILTTKHVISARSLNVFRARDLSCEVARATDVNERVIGCVKQQSPRLNRRQDRAHIKRSVV